MQPTLMFQEVEGFERDMRHFNAALRQVIIKRINDVALVFAQDVSGFASLVRPFTDLAPQPVTMDLGSGYQASLYTVEVAPDVHLVLAVDDDPVFDQVILTLFRAVRSDLLEQACRDAAQMLYNSLPDFVAPQEVAVG